MIGEAGDVEVPQKTKSPDFKAILARKSERKARRKDNARFIAKCEGKKITRAQREKRAKRDGPILWSKVVRARDGHRCVMCGRTDTLAAHHWLFFKSHSVRLALEPDNGVTLCYSDHILKLHRRGDADFVLRLFEKMVAIVGTETIQEMRRLGNNPVPLSLEEREDLVETLRGMPQ